MDYGKLFRIFGDNVTAVLSKFLCTCADEDFTGKQVFWNVYTFFHHFRSSSKKFSKFWREVFGRVFTTAFYMYIGTSWGYLLSFRKIPDFFSRFRNLSCKCVDSQRKLFATVVKIAFSVAKRIIFDEKKISLFRRLYIQHFWSSVKFFVFLGTKLRQACQILIVHVRRTFWGETTLLGKGTNFSFPPEFEQKVFRVLARKFLTWWSQLDSPCRDEDFFVFWRKELKEKLVFSKKNCVAILLGLWEKKILRIFGGMVTAGLSKLRYICSDNILTTVPSWSFFLKFFGGGKRRKIYFFLKISHCYQFQTLSEKRSVILLHAWLRQACQKFVVHVQTKIFKNKFFRRLISFSSFFEIQQKNFRVLTRKIRQCGHNCIIHVHRNIFRKVSFLSKSSVFSRGFRNLSCKCVNSQRKVFATVVKIAFSVAKEAFLMKKINLFKKL